MREVILALVVLLCLYLAWVVMRLFRVSHKPAREQRIEPEYETILDTSDLMREPVPTPLPPAADAPMQPDLAHARAEREAFDALVELARLRFQVEALEAANAALREDFEIAREALGAEIAALRNARSVSPQYGEAVVLAQRGLETEAIAERCGISVSEAELVAALSRGIKPQE
ncbi:DUF2802 domain-containing protein [Niveibacterium sp. 24ML]|uniref:DUF2802 domain-containing protein n=1 Tax=Niveibacterium sp. 24ML TaxID=2985512 RepID=UPI00226FAE06|nr:DUF2802 domain-containing protein [Niveibacterium sp. 24ML]MCX9156893.1 DUF2802 domain-containing protein [Niveibacterium sp. 24ML]